MLQARRLGDRTDLAGPSSQDFLRERAACPYFRFFQFTLLFAAAVNRNVLSFPDRARMHPEARTAV